MKRRSCEQGALHAITAFIPFATAVVGTYSTLPPAGVLYGATLTAASITYNGLLAYLISHRAFKPNVTDAGASYALYRIITLYYFFPRGVHADLPDER
ncbi:MAG: hypothetical protein ACXWNK_09490 [Vulcanimicrobiaceae bacterium]